MSGAGDGWSSRLSSVSDHHAYPENAAYAASKYGLRGLHETLAAEHRGTGVRFALISPGPTDTRIWDPIDPDHRPGLPHHSEMLHPEDVGAAVLFAATRPSRATVEWIRLMPTPAGGAEAVAESDRALLSPGLHGVDSFSAACGARLFWEQRWAPQPLGAGQASTRPRFDGMGSARVLTVARGSARRPLVGTLGRVSCASDPGQMP